LKNTVEKDVGHTIHETTLTRKISMEKENVSDSEQLCCTFAVTGESESFQSIFICRTCSLDAKDLLCVCQACAETCHEDHEGLEYVGIGPSYCDCEALLEGGCKIIGRSAKTAHRLGIFKTVFENSITKRPTGEDGKYVQQTFSIPALDDDDLCSALCLQSEELVKHSKETFWLDASTDLEHCCLLEKLAWHIYRNQINEYKLQGDDLAGGAEWWVQVKSVSLPEINGAQTDPDAQGNEAIDIHFDKDEALAEAFGLGAFPLLSTVTYLTDSPYSPPTIIFPREYGESDDAPISEVFVSRPRKRKHLVFDGRLLHGAPSHFGLRPQRRPSSKCGIGPRITFLVNLWAKHCPAGVSPLPETIRCRIVDLAPSDLRVFPNMFENSGFHRMGTDIVHLDESTESKYDESSSSMIELPFLGKGTTWERSDSNDELSTNVFVYPPPDVESDTYIVRFGSRMEGFIDVCSETQD
jgi:hypothetical protein